ncbi:hypothetical protein HNR42_002741 [Deinobacterium chartae]|uniref:Uncharacterized protein n=1 Tax=Deinobacterium chartae TaxID=521158 RepID=A0A841I210_9DEIO|nr:hypothetical protein [Deinobacterium chartae]MBB6099303.1 hypothetical protein [Deinobacterium chartae]
MIGCAIFAARMVALIFYRRVRRTVGPQARVPARMMRRAVILSVWGLFLLTAGPLSPRGCSRTCWAWPQAWVWRGGA